MNEWADEPSGLLSLALSEKPVHSAVFLERVVDVPSGFLSSTSANLMHYAVCLPWERGEGKESRFQLQIFHKTYWPVAWL